MKIGRDVLARYTRLPDDARALRELLDDVGIEVKRTEGSGAELTMTLELLANRGDHHSYLGIARELHGRTGAGLTRPAITELEVGEPPLPLRCETDLCLVYTATRMTLASEAAPLSAEALAPLTAMDIHAIHPAVDATNLSNHELGQPTHVFDGDTIVGGITVRLSREGEQAWPLFAAERITLPTGTIVIADDEKVLAIAGVIGCEESKTTAASRNLVIESATFEPVAVRKASRELDIRTDSSVRFERGGDPSAPLLGAGRVVHLLAQAGARLEGTTGVVGSWLDPSRTLELDVAHARRFLAVDLSRDKAAARLRRYGFSIRPHGTDHLQVVVPPHRLWDVEHASDLLEELAKSIGYNAIPSTLPPVDMGSLPTEAERVKRTVEDVLVGQGFFEVFTDGFYGNDTKAVLGVGDSHPLAEHVTTLNALDRGYSLLKNNGFVQLLQGVASNVHHQHHQVRMYEWTRTFHPDPAADNGLCHELDILAVMACGEELPPNWAHASRTLDAHHLRGLVRELAVALELPLTMGPLTEEDHPLAAVLHPGRRASVRLHGEVIGVFGEAHPATVQAVGLKRSRPVFLQLERAPLQTQPTARPFVEPPAQPPVTRNLAFTLPHRIESQTVADVLQAAGPDWLEEVRVVDRYDHVEDGAPVHTLTWALTWAHGESTRTADEINAATEALVATVERELGGVGVKLR